MAICYNSPYEERIHARPWDGHAACPRALQSWSSMIPWQLQATELVKPVTTYPRNLAGTEQGTKEAVPEWRKGPRMPRKIVGTHPHSKAEASGLWYPRTKTVAKPHLLRRWRTWSCAHLVLLLFVLVRLPVLAARAVLLPSVHQLTCQSPPHPPSQTYLEVCFTDFLRGFQPS